jgi:tetratricopeptide (TPR) repeat protein
VILDLGKQINQLETGQNNPRFADMMRKQALDKAREQFEKFRIERPDDGEVLRQTALLHRFAANVSRILVDYPSASSAYDAAVDIYRNLESKGDANPKTRDELILTLGDRATLEKRMGKLKAAATTLQSTLELAALQRGKIDDSAYRRTLATTLNDSTDVDYRLGRFDSAADSATRATELFKSLFTVDARERAPTDPIYAAISMHRKALARREQGKTTEAMTAHAEAVAQMKSMSGPRASRDVRYWDCETRREMNWTASAIPDRRAAAVADLGEVIGVLAKLVDEYPMFAVYREGLAAANLRRGELLLVLNQPEQAATEMTKSLAVSRELVDRFGAISSFYLIRGQTYLALGRARAAARKPADATAELQKAVKVFEAGLKIDPDNFHLRRGLAAAQRPPDAAAK